ncbi:MAG: histidine kinase N-terminal 7TM domain-containing protein, partial [Candidatus Aenigmatarchaeota archaeon]
MGVHLFFLIIISLINFFLGFLVWQADKKNIINKSFWSFICFVILWSITLYISDLPLQTSYALFWNKLTLVSGLLFSSSFAHFCLVFIKKEGFLGILKPPFLFIILFLLFSLILLTLFTNLIVARIEFFEWGANIIPGNLYFLVGGFYLSAAIIGLASLTSKYRKSIGTERIQIQYLFLGFLFAAIGILTTNLIHPAITGTNPYAKYGPYFVTFFVFFTTLAITRYHLFEIRVILTEILVGVMGIILAVFSLIGPTLSPNILRFLSIFVFFLFLFFGYYLIKATHEEERRREKAEMLAQQESQLRIQFEIIAKRESELRREAEKIASERERLADNLMVVAVRSQALKRESDRLASEWKELAEAKDQFLTSIQHHLRTPLTAIMGFCELLLKNEKRLENIQETRDKIEKIKRSANVLHQLVESILDATGDRIKKTMVYVEEVDVIDLIED